ncbi:unnamed protein product [Meganyctiphanes norvegica]|uniref:Uncharacterized protein n=1 Tax=Meganyctiphanes norvegica TaxID=48144 RepID=A0AAV2SI76_MEGNR
MANRKPVCETSFSKLCEALKPRVREFDPESVPIKDRIGYIRRWFGAFSMEVSGLCMCGGIDESALEEKHYNILVRSKLPYTSVRMIETHLLTEAKCKTLDILTLVEFEEILTKIYCIIEHPVIGVLNALGSHRDMKSKDSCMLDHFDNFQNNLHPCFYPTTDKEFRDFPDLIKRAAFFASLDDPEVQDELLKIPEDKASLVEYTLTANTISMQKRH